MGWSTKLGAVLSVTIGLPAVGLAQVPYDPPTAVKPAPNVMLLMDATRTTLINGENCRGICHQEGVGYSGRHEWSTSIYAAGETRLQLARRVLTGGWGWDTGHVDGTNGAASAEIRGDGVMDAYKVRWGVAWYDGVGVRLAINPTADNLAAQEAVIDFGYNPDSPNTEILGTGIGGVDLNSYLPFYRSTQCCGNHDSGSSAPPPPTRIPFWADAADAHARQARALRWVHDYYKPGVAPPTFTVGAGSEMAGYFQTQPVTTNDTNVIEGDPPNVLNAPAGQESSAAYCRRNFVIMLLDGHGSGSWDPDGAGGPEVAITPATAAGEIFNMTTAANGTLPSTKRNQAFAIHFGAADQNPAHNIADTGFDGTADGFPPAFLGAPGGEIQDLSSMFAAFSAVMGIVTSGSYVGTSPAVTRFGEFLLQSQFSIADCSDKPPSQCNIGRPGELSFSQICTTDGGCGAAGEGDIIGVEWNAGEILRARAHAARIVLSGMPTGSAIPAESNCGAYATCGDTAAQIATVPAPSDLASPTAVVTDTTWAPTGLTNNDVSFLRGNPLAMYANGVFRGDVECDALTGTGCCKNASGNLILANFPACLDHHYKIADVANSRPVIVGAPGGVGEDLARWEAFRDTTVARSGSYVGALNNDPSGSPKIKARDQVAYIGGNDGMLHAFLLGVAKAENDPTRRHDRVADYEYQPSGLGSCAFSPGTPDSTVTAREYCGGAEIWAYSPKLLQPSWPLLQTGHYYMIDGAPVVSDVLFTKDNQYPNGSLTAPENLCNEHNTTGCVAWEYRTVLLQCLGAGGPGCFAMDVSNPFNPQLLWERAFTSMPGRGTSTSKPQIARAMRDANGTSIPYYVALMGGGMNEVNPANGDSRGTFIAVGLEDGLVMSSQSTGVYAEGDFAGAPTCLDADSDSFVDTCYIITTNGLVYKIRITGGEPEAANAITMHKFYNSARGVKRHLNLASDPDLKTYTRVIATYNKDGTVSLFYGSGDFEDVQNASEENYFFKVVDHNPTEAPATWSNTVNDGRTAAGTCGSPPSGTAFSGPQGTRGTHGILPLAGGEKVIFDPVIAGGTVFFTSFKPNANSCQTGEGYLYGIKYDTCDAGIDTDPSNTNDDFVERVDFNASAPAGLLTAPVVNEETGNVYVTSDSGATTTSAAHKPPQVQTPMIKLWWREVLP